MSLCKGFQFKGLCKSRSLPMHSWEKSGRSLMRVELHHTRTTPRYGKQLLPKESLCRRHEIASKKTAPQRAPFAMTAERFSSPLVVHTLQIQQERVLERNIFVLLVVARNSSMSRFHLGLEQDIVVICFHRPELCGQVRVLAGFGGYERLK